MRLPEGPIIIVGGSGFIGSNLADSYLRDGEDVIVLDNLSRPGVEQNLRWLKSNHGDRVQSAIADIRDFDAIAPYFIGARAVFHLAAQTAVTTSLDHPLHDFETNARGTLNVLEAVRKAGNTAPIIFSSTNKVYGDIHDIAMAGLEDRYIPADELLREHGFDEDRRLNFCTPYGCSKGVADQYVLDYAKSFGSLTAVLRMSCIYGPRQFGTEDQGWVAHFLIRALNDEAISIYGDGRQVRDILHVDDAVRAYRGLLSSIDEAKGKAFNLGGGPDNAVSIRIVLREIERIIGRPIATMHSDWRVGDQLYFVTNTSALREAIGWAPEISWRDGVRDLCDWLVSNRLGDSYRARRASA
ncbi:CDP-paratose 2-epimerase [Rhizobium sp. ERR 922]|nr:CDP-paratose 2-epimerase [Rhizobium sp. ERR 922]TWB90173.1 CDP-paratose 2-epimerase [Rhizobium sp. ERR 942]